MPTINKLPKQKRKSNGDNRKIRIKFYNSTKWQKLRNTKLSDQPLCEKCLENNRITLANQVHHIVSFMSATNDDDRSILFFDYDNLMSICESCHGDIHGKKNNIRYDNR